MSVVKRKYVHEVLVNRLFNLAQKKSVVKCTDHSNMTIAIYCDVKQPKNKSRREEQRTSCDWWPSGAFRIKKAYLAGL